MSYDLYFYKKKNSSLSTKVISDYLSEKLTQPNEQGTQWFFENPDTEVYYSFDKTEPDIVTEPAESNESFADYEDAWFSFNINFMRPAFFGLEAFAFVDQFVNDLDLYVLDPQSASEIPYKPTQQELISTWHTTNAWASRDHFDKLQSAYLPEEESNRVWAYNRQRAALQQELGEEYFVPRIFFFRTKEENKVITFSAWTEHIPTILPFSDYFFLGKTYRKWFKRIAETVIIDRQTLLQEFGSSLHDFSIDGCKILHPQNAALLKDKFNALKSNISMEEFAERLPIENLFNEKPV